MDALNKITFVAVTIGWFLIYMFAIGILLLLNDFIWTTLLRKHLE